MQATTSAEVRSHLIRAMQLDLVGPTLDDRAAHSDGWLGRRAGGWLIHHLNLYLHYEFHS
ncbi:MAG: hypothetical protein HWQ38_22030 [Nostoc sp. NMS7]|uniref:hypothetical protein n=1 Tax=Nostoc sp. NMS7 TaxID=2815391 RepID=UPI0025E07811|nr:hypothetical protein [Nostoc sp. NMS7]MBN3948996.1 hypothetical protein [Nostoc sp. NMS7]